MEGISYDLALYTILIELYKTNYKTIVIMFLKLYPIISTIPVHSCIGDYRNNKMMMIRKLGRLCLFGHQI